MKKIFGLIIVFFITILLVTGCSNKESSYAANLFEFEKDQVVVTVDLKDGWNVEFGINATYLYDKKDAEDVVANAVYVSKDEYKEIVDEYKGYDSYKEIDNGITFEESTSTKYIVKVTDDTYMMVIVRKESKYNAQEVFERFSFKKEEI